MEFKPTPLYRVTVTEYEAGCGQRDCPEDTKLFTTLEEANAYAKKMTNKDSYEIFWNAEITRLL